MTDDDIQKLLDETKLYVVQEMFEAELRSFARAIESRTLTREKARWYQTGVEAERHDIAKMVENYCGAWDDKGQALVQMIRSRGE